MKLRNGICAKLYLDGIEIESRKYDMDEWHLVTRFGDFDYGHKFRVKPKYEYEYEDGYEYQWLIKCDVNKGLFISNFFKTEKEMINYYGRDITVLECLVKYKREVKEK